MESLVYIVLIIVSAKLGIHVYVRGETTEAWILSMFLFTLSGVFLSVLLSSFNLNF